MRLFRFVTYYNGIIYTGLSDVMNVILLIFSCGCCPLSHTIHTSDLRFIFICPEEIKYNFDKWSLFLIMIVFLQLD